MLGLSQLTEDESFAGVIPCIRFNDFSITTSQYWRPLKKNLITTDAERKNLYTILI